MFKDFKKMWKSPQTIALSVLLLALLAILIATTTFIPLYLSLMSFVVFIGIAVATLYGQMIVTRAKQKENRPKSKQLKTVLENMNEGVIIYSPDFEILDINKAAEKILNIKSKEIEGEKVSPDSLKSDKTRILAQVIFPSLAPVVDKVSEGWPQEININIENPEKKLNTIVERIRDDSGNVLAFIKIVKDKTREKKVLDAKTSFITTTAHQIRTPLSGISWAFETILDSTEDEEIIDVANKGYALSSRALKIINDLLTVTEIEEGGFNLELSEVSAQQLSKHIIKDSEAIADQYDVNLNFDQPNQDYTLKIDKKQIGIVLSILVDNGITYNQEGGSVVLTFKKVKNKPFVRFEVRDTGMGMSDKELENIFKKFYRGDKASKTEPNGSGLGLYIAKNIIESHGGQIWAQSSVGRGTTFYLTLPIAN